MVFKNFSDGISDEILWFLDWNAIEVGFVE